MQKIQELAKTIANDEHYQSLRTQLSLGLAEIEPKLVVNQQTHEVTIVPGSAKNPVLTSDLMKWYLEHKYAKAIEEINAEAGQVSGQVSGQGSGSDDNADGQAA